MVPAGYMAKRVQTPTGFHIDGVAEVYSVSDCVNDDFADYIQYWKHNGYWLFDSPQIIRTVAQEHSIQLDGTSLFYYEVYNMEFDGKTWSKYEAESSLPTNVLPPKEKVLEGFDVVTFYAKNAPEHSLPFLQRRSERDSDESALPAGIVYRGVRSTQWRSIQQCGTGSLPHLRGVFSRMAPKARLEDSTTQNGFRIVNCFSMTCPSCKSSE
jgi:hypothetical protein